VTATGLDTLRSGLRKVHAAGALGCVRVEHWARTHGRSHEEIEGLIAEIRLEDALRVRPEAEVEE
jgi:hypothetical protein